MFKNLLNLNLNSDVAEHRLKAIAELDAANLQNQLQLQHMSIEDASAECRRAAMLKVTDPAWLFKIYTESELGNEESRSNAYASLIHVLGPKGDLSEAEFRKLVADTEQLTNLVACHCPHGEYRDELIGAMPLTQQIELLSELEYTDSRQSIVNQLSEIDDLERARNLLRGKDKSAERIVRAKLDALHSDEKQQRAVRESAEAICEKIEHMVKLDWRPEFKASFSVWQQRWQALEQNPPEELLQRFEKAETVMAARIKEKDELAKAEKKSASLANSLEAYCSTLAKLRLEELQEQQAAILKIQRNAAEDRLRFLEMPKAKAKKMKQDEERFNLAQSSLTSVAEFCAAWDFKADSAIETADTKQEQAQLKGLKAAIAGLTWPASYMPLLAKIEAQEIIADLEAHIEVAREASKENLDKIHQRINRLIGAATKGNVAMAKRELAAMTKAAARYQGKDKAQLDDRLERAAEVVGNMEDWRDFATEPKFISLCEKMEALVGSDQHADKLAKKIADLQQAWKQLGHSTSADTHWQRFKTAADAAYAPCAEFFAQRHAQRKENLARREPFIEQLRALLQDTKWVETPQQQEHPDYKAIERELQTIQSKWQSIKDVEQKPGQKQWKRYSKVRKAIYEKLDVIYQANIELKHQLIAQAELMLDTDVKEESLAKLKLLQSKWKQVGVTRRSDDQKAWKKFKKATDAVFGKLQDGRQQKRAEEDAMIADHKRIIDAIYQIVRGAEDLVEADKGFEQLQSEYNALPPLPKILPERLIEKVQGDYARANNAFAITRDKLLAQQKQKRVNALAEKAAICQKIEKLAGDSADEGNAEVAELQAEYHAIELSDRAHAKRIDERFNTALEKDKSAASEKRRALCIDLEILLDKPSPKEDAARRMQTQLERMKSQGFGHQQISVEQSLKEMRLDWMCLPGAEAPVQAELDRRFDALMAHAPKPNVAKPKSARQKSNKKRSFKKARPQNSRSKGRSRSGQQR